MTNNNHHSTMIKYSHYSIVMKKQSSLNSNKQVGIHYPRVITQSNDLRVITLTTDSLEAFKGSKNTLKAKQPNKQKKGFLFAVVVCCVCLVLLLLLLCFVVFLFF